MPAVAVGIDRTAGGPCCDWHSPRGARRRGGRPGGEEHLLVGETRVGIAAAIASLPLVRRTVSTPRDVEQWSSEEVRNVLDSSETNVRVLLHRARSKVRRALEQYLEGEGPTR
jgi:RNA polymerase sigma-70 factor (ECF subfamily)